MVLEAILLGLSTGTYCTMYCAPVLIPFLFGCEKSSHKRNAGLTGVFLCGRVAMYYVLGAVFAAMGLLKNGELNAGNYVHIGTWANIPEVWLGKEASFSMMLDWITEAQIAVAANLAERQKQGDQTVMMADPM